MDGAIDLYLYSDIDYGCFAMFGQAPRSLQYKIYASDVYFTIYAIRHLLISVIPATDTLCTTDLYYICDIL